MNFVFVPVSASELPIIKADGLNPIKLVFRVSVVAA